MNGRKEKIRNCLRELGVPEHLSGYNYLLSAVDLVVRDPTLLRRMMSGLYPAVADRYHSTPQRTERAIRHAIETACLRCDPNVLTAYFGNTISPDKGKPVNSEFIARISNAVRQEEYV